MTGSRISKTVTHTVVLGSKHYASPLTVTATGVIRVESYDGAAGISGAQAGDKIVNHGSITAATGGYYENNAGAGGVGIDLSASGTIVNTGRVFGGYGGYTGDGLSTADGGNGIDAAGGKIVNSGLVLGGTASSSKYRLPGKSGGVGVDVTGAGLALSNSGTISGGESGHGAGGVGVVFTAAGTLRNTGTISGGRTGGVVSGAGVSLASGCVLVNGGEIKGGYGGIGLVAAGSTIRNDESIAGGAGVKGVYGQKYTYIAGGDGVSLTGGVLTNVGVIAGGTGTSPYGGHGGTQGGAGVIDTGGAIFNNGTIEGGASYSSTGGNDGVELGAGASLTNHGTILGGKGENSDSGSFSISGAAGLVMTAAATAVNSGLIQGGSGTYRDGSGGAGATVAIGGVLTNTGTVAGGAGGSPDRNSGGFGGAGVEIQGGTLVTSGTIIGGPDTVGGTMGDAVQFTEAAGTLVLMAGAVFEGNIVADPTVNDTLELAGSLHGTLSGFDTSITGFSTITEDSHAHWTLDGAISGTGSIALNSDAYLALSSGTVSIASIVFGAGGGETLYFGAPASVSSTLSGFGTGDRIDLDNIQASSLKYADGTLTLLDANNAIVDTLTFAGNYNTADFTLQREGQTTEVVYAGENALPLSRNFMTQNNGHASLSPLVAEPVHMAMPHQDGLPFFMAWPHG